ncbi:glycosyltransferase family 39 protein, partial [Patescibacteria group bacterium]|nr:glycosyltransferase family 39 protein [Patescibacteria group bacterium]
MTEEIVKMIEIFAAKIEKFVLSHRLLLLILLVTFLVRLPSLFEPLWYGDEAIYLTIGQKIVRGGLMYLEIFDHKTPGIYYLAAAVIKTLGESIWSFRFFLMVWVLATTVIFYITTKEMFSKKVALAAVVVLSVLISTPLIEGTITNSEVLMILPTMVGILFGLRKRFFLAGVFFSLSFLLKFTGIFDFGAFFIFAALAVKKDEIKETIKRLVALTLGWFLPVFMTIVFFAINGGLSAYFDSAFLYNVSYTAYQNSFLFSNGVLVLKALPAILVLGYFVFRSFDRFKKKGETG